MCASYSSRLVAFFLFNDTAPTEIYTLSLHDALPIFRGRHRPPRRPARRHAPPRAGDAEAGHSPDGRPRDRKDARRSEEHTSELQSRQYLVCRLLLEKKNTTPPSFASLALRARPSISS